MEKQPVDNLFARKLRDAESPVRADMFSELQQRMSTKPLPARRHAAGWWSAASAACLLVALWFLSRVDMTQAPDTVSMARKQESVKAEPVATAQQDQSANVPERNRQVNSKETKSASYNSQLAQVRTRHFRQGIPTSQSRAEVQVTVSPVQSLERVTVISQQQTQQLPASATTIIPLPVERISERKELTTERTIILTIDDPQMATTLASAKAEPSTPPNSPTHQNGLSGLFGKLKQLKNGEVLAKATITPNQSNPKNRFGRVFTEVKESLKNETTLD